jgi:LmbE family N-acetylglucosaminyl deacetylase
MDCGDLSLTLRDIPSFMAIGAHCDDIDLHCGGTFARLTREGSRGCYVVGVENAYVGPHYVVASSHEGLAVRRAEATRAAAILGAEKVEWLGMKSGYFSTAAPGSTIYPRLDSLETIHQELRDAIFSGLPPVAHARYHPDCVARLTDIIRSFSPALILTHFPDDIHHDHYSLAGFVVHVVRRLRRNCLREIPLWFWEPGSYGPMAGFAPDRLVELTAGDVATKQAAIDCYASQFSDQVRTFAADRSRAYGRIAGLEYAEGFSECRFYQGNPWQGEAEFLKPLVDGLPKRVIERLGNREVGEK